MGLRKSTHMWIHVVCVALNFTGLILALLQRNWLFIGLHCFALYVSQSYISDVATELDKIETKEDKENE